MAADVDEIVATGVNCCLPDDVDHGARRSRRVRSSPTRTPARAGTRSVAPGRGDSAFDAGAVTGWLDAGVRLVGGCCRVGPTDIAAVAAAAAARA